MPDGNTEAPVNGAPVLVVSPYLLDPRSDGVTLAWESDQTGWSVDVWQKGQGPDDPWLRFPATERSTEIDGVWSTLHTVRLDGLLAGTPHEYRIVHEGVAAATGHFSTLASNRDQARLLLLSDPHMFTIHEQIEERISAFNPEFVIHAGDIPAGTGYQKEQYTDGWFGRIRSTLSRVPFVYAPGNHDDGPYFDFYFSEQSRGHPRDASRRSFSLDHAGVHLVMLDSNSWGLSEMNAVNSGLEVGEDIRERIDGTLEWLRDDLASVAARTARWRIVVLHHPYTDEYTNRYVVPIVEEAGVDIMFGAHVHSYVKAVSLDPTHGNTPLYLTLPSAQQPETGYTTGDPDRRLMTDFPEVVATGNGNYATLEVSPEHLVVQIYGFRGDSHRPEVIDRQVVSARPYTPELQDVSLTPVLDGDEPPSVLVSCRAVNTSGQAAVVTVPVKENGVPTVHVLTGMDPAQTRVIHLDPGEQAKCIVRHVLTGAGARVIRVADVVLRVDVPTPRGVRVVLDDAELDRVHSEVLLPLEITNPAEEQVHLEVCVLQDGCPTVQQPLDLGPGEVVSRCMHLPHPGRGTHVYSAEVASSGSQVDPDAGTRTVDRSQEVRLDIDDALVVAPLVLDRSGWGNHGILRGHPFLGTREDGSAFVRFDHEEDYVEVPPSPSLRLPEGYVASVHSCVKRLARPGEMAHNPLMVRGKGVGWGATYFLRMVIDRTGTMKWGTCHGSTEYGWAGGEAHVGEWGDYVLAFDRLKGGVSCIDGEVVGTVPGIGDAEALNEYADEPLFVGYSRIGHVIPDVGTPKYVTHLWGSVDDVRLAAPSAWVGERGVNGRPEEDLRLHLDFSEVVTGGVHTSAWRRPRGLRAFYMRDFDRWTPDGLSSDAEVPPGTSVRVTVETSDDSRRILSSTEVTLGDGTHTQPLEGLRPAQFARLTIAMDGAVVDGRVQVPRVRRLDLNCVQAGLASVLTWQTHADWSEGVSEGAVGIEPADRLRIHDKYTDVIHG